MLCGFCLPVLLQVVEAGLSCMLLARCPVDVGCSYVLTHLKTSSIYCWGFLSIYPCIWYRLMACHLSGAECLKSLAAVVCIGGSL